MTRPPQLMTIRDIRSLGLDEREVRRSFERGELVRVKRGAYCGREEWERMKPIERHLLLVYATHESHPNAVFSHWSAAAIHGLPLVGPIPVTVHVSDERAPGGRSETGLTRHCVGLLSEDVAEVEGIPVTSVARTLLDLARSQAFRFAVAPIDHSLRMGLVTKEGLLHKVDPQSRGSDKLTRAISFANPLADNPGESLSRAVIHELGFPTPLLQVEHVTHGVKDITDFKWPKFRLIGEFDGLGKYLKEEYLGPMTPGEAVYAEKRREDRLRPATGCAFARWGWDDAFATWPLRRILLDAGLRPEK